MRFHIRSYSLFTGERNADYLVHTNLLSRAKHVRGIEFPTFLIGYTINPSMPYIQHTVDISCAVQAVKEVTSSVRVGADIVKLQLI